MMGQFILYNSYVDDLFCEHDCMWNGHCPDCCHTTSATSAEPKKEQQQQQQEEELELELAAAVVVEAGAARAEAEAHQQCLVEQSLAAAGPPGLVQVGQTQLHQPHHYELQPHHQPHEAGAGASPPSAVMSGDLLSPADPEDEDRKSSPMPLAGRRHRSQAATALPVNSCGPIRRQRITAVRESRRQQKPYAAATGANESATRKQQKYASQDVKKLRHREVEKNRHRLLQAMVKTLSERIPGRLDKETQVQTMKRAARYCVFLREAANELSRVAEPVAGAGLKARLDKIYLVARDQVELLMGQS